MIYIKGKPIYSVENWLKQYHTKQEAKEYLKVALTIFAILVLALAWSGMAEKI